MIRLLHGDCLEQMRSLPVASVALGIADPPFGCTQAEWDRPLDMPAFFAEFWRVAKVNAALVVFGTQPFASDVIAAGRRWFKYDLIWRKNKASGHLNAKKMPLRAHESMLIFCRSSPQYEAQKTVGHKPMNFAVRRRHSDLYGAMSRPTESNVGATDRYPVSVLDFPVVNNDDDGRVHPTQKPVSLLRWLIRTYSLPGDIVLDPVMGSGATGEAAVLEGRSFVGIEQDKPFFAAARERLEVFS